MSYHLISVRMATIKKLRNKCWRALEKREPCALLVGMQTGAATVENSIEVPQKSKYRTTI